jgi:hypothetical protein
MNSRRCIAKGPERLEINGPFIAASLAFLAGLKVVRFWRRRRHCPCLLANYGHFFVNQQTKSGEKADLFFQSDRLDMILGGAGYPPGKTLPAQRSSEANAQSEILLVGPSGGWLVPCGLDGELGFRSRNSLEAKWDIDFRSCLGGKGIVGHAVVLEFFRGSRGRSACLG